MITVTKNSADITSQVSFPSLSATQNLTNEVDTATFALTGTADALLKEDGSFLLQENGSHILIVAPPAFDDNIVISDGATVIFAGKIAKVDQRFEYPREAAYIVSCVDHTFQMDRKLAARTYTNTTVQAIIADLVTSYAPGFTYANTSSTFVIPKIVFNQVPLSQCFRRLADIVRYDWYVDENKDVHFFPASTNTAPYSLTDTAGNHVYKSLTRSLDGSQVINRVRVRGGEYDGASFTDTITVSGSATKSFNLPYKMSSLQIDLDTGTGFVAQTVGIDFIDTFTDFQVLYDFQGQSFHFNAALAAGNKVRFTGVVKTPVVAAMEDSTSIAQYGPIEKFVRDASIKSNTVARKRAAAELMTYTDGVIDARFTTYTSGLRTGMLLSVQAGGLGDSLLIKRVAFTARTPQTFQYDVQCISTQRYTLIDLLRKIITPDPQPTDESEVSEQIYPASEAITLSDTASANTPSNPPVILRSAIFNGGATGSSETTTFDCTGAAALVIVVPYSNGITGVTCNGVAMTSDLETSPGGYGASVWRTNSPPTGTQTIVFNSGQADLLLLCQMFAVAGINTSDALEATGSSNVAADHKTVSVMQANNVMSIGFFTAHLKDSGTNGFGNWTPDAGLGVEEMDQDGFFSTSHPSTIISCIFSRPGTKTLGSTYTSPPVQAYEIGETMVLYNGFVGTS